jgi:putative effector of murein hydrolase
MVIWKGVSSKLFSQVFFIKVNIHERYAEGVDMYTKKHELGQQPRVSR